MSRIELVDGTVVEAVLDLKKEMACYLDIETDDFVTIDNSAFTLISEDDGPIEIPPQNPTQTLAHLLGAELKSLSVEFK